MKRKMTKRHSRCVMRYMRGSSKEAAKYLPSPLHKSSPCMPTVKSIWPLDAERFAAERVQEKPSKAKTTWGTNVTLFYPYRSHPRCEEFLHLTAYIRFSVFLWFFHLLLLSPPLYICGTFLASSLRNTTALFPRDIKKHSQVFFAYGFSSSRDFSSTHFAITRETVCKQNGINIASFAWGAFYKCFSGKIVGK